MLAFIILSLRNNLIEFALGIRSKVPIKRKAINTIQEDELT